MTIISNGTLLYHLANVQDLLCFLRYQIGIVIVVNVVFLSLLGLLRVPIFHCVVIFVKRNVSEFLQKH